MISVLNDQNLYDIDTGDFNSTIKNNTNQSGLAYLMQYSQLENSNQKAKDFKTMRTVSKKSFSSSNLKTALSNMFNKVSFILKCFLLLLKKYLVPMIEKK